MSEVTSAKTSHSFQADVSQVLSLVINSLYSHKEVFLRELLSNASDALDRRRFQSITQPQLLTSGESLKVRLVSDKEKKTLVIWDNGIGMTAEELATNLGTIARSGSREFLQKLQSANANKSDVNLIGQFGVGFYSAYLVADRVDVVSRAANAEHANRWSSDAKEGFTIEPAEREAVGTSVIMHVKPEHEEFLESWRLRELVRRYSDYLSYPIELEVEREENGQKTKAFEAINQGKALWQRAPSEVTKEQYEEFYKHLTHDWEPPLAYRHFKIEGNQEFTGLIFIPKRPPFDLFSPESQHGLRLHVKRVFIMDNCEDLVPRWLRFMRGVVDSEDLPLNVSRELLQDSRIVAVIRKQVVKQALDLLTDLAREKSEDYAAFWRNFGAVMKEGLHFEPESKERLTKLVRYESSRNDGLVSFETYKERMAEGQKAMYYVVTENRRAAESSPHLEALNKRGYEVLYMTDPVDQWAIQGMSEFEKIPLASAADPNLKLDETTDDKEKEDKEETASTLRPLLERFRMRLQDLVSEVRVSERLTESPVCLVVPEGGLPPHLERLLRATKQGAPPSKRIMEINPTHPLIQNLKHLVDKNTDSARVDNWIHMLFEQALIAEGSPIENPAKFSRDLTQIMQEVTSG